MNLNQFSVTLFASSLRLSPCTERRLCDNANSFLTEVKLRSLCVSQPFVVAVWSGLLRGAVAAAGSLARVVGHHPDDVQQTGEQLQAEVEDANPQA